MQPNASAKPPGVHIFGLNIETLRQNHKAIFVEEKIMTRTISALALAVFASSLSAEEHF